MERSQLMINLMHFANNQQMVNLLSNMMEKNSAIEGEVKEMKKLVVGNWKLGPLEVYQINFCNSELISYLYISRRSSRRQQRHSCLTRA